MINLDFFINRLSANAKTFELLCRNQSDETALWRQTAEKWSLQQIVYHLSKTEEKDFRPRLEKTLRDAAESWTPLDPAEMRLEQTAGGENKLSEYLEKFLTAREISTAWLKEIENPNWENAHLHNERLTLAAGDLMASWLAHDFLHLKQIIRLQYDYTNFLSAPFSTDYAGKWT
jgi:hypothetical protein